MSQRRSLPFQAACIRDVISYARTESTRDGLEGALATIEWLEKHADLIRMHQQLRLGNPQLFEALHAVATVFPGAQVVDVRGSVE